MKFKSIAKSLSDWWSRTFLFTNRTLRPRNVRNTLKFSEFSITKKTPNPKDNKNTDRRFVVGLWFFFLLFLFSNSFCFSSINLVILYSYCIPVPNPNIYTAQIFVDVLIFIIGWCLVLIERQNTDIYPNRRHYTKATDQMEITALLWSRTDDAEGKTVRTVFVFVSLEKRLRGRHYSVQTWKSSSQGAENIPFSASIWGRKITKAFKVIAKGQGLKNRLPGANYLGRLWLCHHWLLFEKNYANICEDWYRIGWSWCHLAGMQVYSFAPNK